MSNVLTKMMNNLKNKVTSRDDYFAPFAENDRILTEAGYGDLVGSNYWKNLTYTSGILDKIVGALGGRTGEDRFWENAAMQYGEYQAGLLEQMHQEEFDSPLEQSKRMRQAGQNSDLLGTGDVAQSPGTAEDTNNVLPSDVSDAVSGMIDFATGIGKYFQGALGMISTFQQLSSGRLALRSQRTDLERNNMGFALDFIIGHSPEEFPDFDPDSDYSYTDNEGGFVSGKAGDFFMDAQQMMRYEITDAWNAHKKRYGGFVSDRDWNQISKYISRMVHSLPATKEQYSAWRQQAMDKLAYGQQLDSEFYQKDFDDLLAANLEYRKQLDEVQKQVAVLEKKLAESGTSEAGYKQEYFDALNGSDIASMETAQLGNQLSIQDRTIESLGLDNDVKRIMKKVEDAKNKIVQRWSEQADAGNPFAKFMLWQYSLDQSDALGIGSIREQANTQAQIGSRFAGSIIP